MGYKEKIQLLEDNLAKLDHELKSVKSVVQSSIASTLMLMENYNDELDKLSKKTEEFGIVVKKAVEKHDKEKVEKLLKDLDILQSETDNSRQKIKPAHLMVKQSLSQSLDEYRLQSTIIRTISIPTSDYLDTQILELEKLFRKFGEYIDQWVAGTAKSDDRKLLVDEIQSLERSILQTVTVARDCIKSTIAKFKD